MFTEGNIRNRSIALDLRKQSNLGNKRIALDLRKQSNLGNKRIERSDTRLIAHERAFKAIEPEERRSSLQLFDCVPTRALSRERWP